MRTMRWQTGTVAAMTILALACGVNGCKSNSANQPAQIVDANNGPDPAAANLAPVDPNAAPVTAPDTSTATNYASAPVASAPRARKRVLSAGSSAPQYSSSESYPATQPDNQNYSNPNQNYSSQPYQDSYRDPDYDQQADQGQAALYAEQPPPPLPTYQQPQLTEPGYLWTPGYWSYGAGGYYWVPGAWVAPPYQGALWTPGYWGYSDRRYGFHRGFWARHIGFYGGIDYGFGYVGTGYQGGYWNNNNFFYNNAVNRVNTDQIRNVYVRNVTTINNTTINTGR